VRVSRMARRLDRSDAGASNGIEPKSGRSSVADTGADAYAWWSPYGGDSG
jgi:hypothetical protein